MLEAPVVTGKTSVFPGKGGTGDTHLRGAFPEAGGPARPRGAFSEPRVKGQDVGSNVAPGARDQAGASLNKPLQLATSKVPRLKIEVTTPWGVDQTVKGNKPPNHNLARFQVHSGWSVCSI